MKDISIILPIHLMDEDHKIMFNNAVESVQPFYNDVKLVIVAPKKLIKDIKVVAENLEVQMVSNEGETDFCSQVNLGIQNCGTEWFSILEVDDEYRPNWLKSVSDYRAENPDVEVFLPIIRDVNVEGKFLSFTNEAPWAYGFSEKQGVLENEALLDYQNFQTSGGLYKTQTVIDNGMFKENIKLTFTYEFLLRLTHNNVPVMVVPRIGYQHVNFRENSLFWNYKNGEDSKLNQDEVTFWLETAKREFFFKNKRDVTYEVS